MALSTTTCVYSGAASGEDLERGGEQQYLDERSFDARHSPE